MLLVREVGSKFFIPICTCKEGGQQKIIEICGGGGTSQIQVLILKSPLSSSPLR